MVGKGSENQNAKPQERKPDIRLMVNDSKVRQVIGALTLRPRQGEDIDVSPGTMGHALMTQGVLVEPSKVRKRERPQEQSAEDGAEPQTGRFVCPWCYEAINGVEAARSHIAIVHVHNILSGYGAIIEQMGVRHVVSADPDTANEAEREEPASDNQEKDESERVDA